MRVSTDKQQFDMQHKAVMEYVNSLDEKPTYRMFKDFAQSGKRIQRPKYQELKRRVSTGEFDAVICYRLDRFSRSSSEALRTILEFDELGVQFVAVDQKHLHLTDDNPFKNTFLALMADFAQIEREIIVSRVKRGLEAAKAKGKQLGRPTKVDNDILQKIIRLNAAGLSSREIGANLGISYGTVCKHLRASS